MAGKKRIPPMRGQGNNYIKSNKAVADQARAFGFDMGAQITADAAILAANEVFGSGPERNKKFMDSLNRWANEIGRISVECSDAKDTELSYLKTRLDGRMKEICGKYFVPWDIRYMPKS